MMVSNFKKESFTSQKNEPLTSLKIKSLVKHHVSPVLHHYITLDIINSSLTSGTLPPLHLKTSHHYTYK